MEKSRARLSVLHASAQEEESMISDDAEILSDEAEILAEESTIAENEILETPSDEDNHSHASLEL